MRKPDFNNLLAVLNKKVPSRPTLFEFFFNAPLMEKLAGEKFPEWKTDAQSDAMFRIRTKAYAAAGYDYSMVHGSTIRFPTAEIHHDQSISLNEGCMIRDRESFEKYQWPDPDNHNYEAVGRMSEYMPDGMKAIVCGPGGVLENVVRIVGYDNLCFMMIDEPELAKDIFDAVGGVLLKHYSIAAQFESVGALMINDDWGFKTQTMISPSQLREYVIPWHKKYAEAAHKAGKAVMMHSCGKLDEVMDDIINVIKFDGKHSYEDAIHPVEEAYETLRGKIAVLGGIDLDFLCRSSEEDVIKRSRAMMEKGMQYGGYALGSGNSIPEYVPAANFFAMNSVATGVKITV